jgi:hypothetical protein
MDKIQSCSHIEQLCLSVAAHKLGLSIGKMKSDEYMYEWPYSPYDSKRVQKATVYHTGEPRFMKYVMYLDRINDINLGQAYNNSVKSKYFYQTQIYRAEYLIKDSMDRLDLSNK